MPHHKQKYDQSAQNSVIRLGPLVSIIPFFYVIAMLTNATYLILS